MQALAQGLGTGALVVLFSGCFSYVPMELDAVPAGEDVRIYMTRTGLAQLPEEVAPDNGPVVRGTLVRRDADQLFLRIPIAVRREGFHSAVLGQEVQIPTGDVVQIERREFNRVGTGLLVAGTVGLAAGVVLFILDDSRQGEGDGPPEPPEIRIPLFTIPIG